MLSLTWTLRPPFYSPKTSKSFRHEPTVASPAGVLPPSRDPRCRRAGRFGLPLKGALGLQYGVPGAGAPGLNALGGLLEQEPRLPARIGRPTHRLLRFSVRAG